MHITTISYGLAAFVYFVFFSILLTDKHHGTNKLLLLAAALTSAVWTSWVAYESIDQQFTRYTHYLAILKNLVWISFIGSMLYVLKDRSNAIQVFKDDAFKIISAIVISAVLILLLYAHVDTRGNELLFFISIHLLLSVIGIVTVEQLYRNVSQEQRWVIKYLCIGFLGMFIYEFYMYSDALLYQRVDAVLWQAHGFVLAFLVPLIAYSVLRDPMWSPEIFISRRVVFHTTTLLASAIYLFIMGVVGYYVKEYGGEWGGVIQALLMFAMVVLLTLLLMSRRIRARLKVFLNKHFYPYKYDYREEWLRLIRTISSSTAMLHKESIRAIAQIIDSPAGILWINTGHGNFECVAGLDMEPLHLKEPTRSTLPVFMQDHEFVINVDEYKVNPEMYSRLGELVLPDWVYEKDFWLIVPLIHIDTLIGFIALDHAPERKKHFNWEDSDLLKTASRQVASYISQQKISIALAEAKQFERFNKISTYIVHDIKNLVTQLSLIVSNADKHKNNPLFMQDAVKTIDNTVQKMNKMLDVVSDRPNDDSNSHRINIIDVLQEVIDYRKITSSRPVPVLDCSDNEVYIRADRDQLLSIFGHLVQNAQDATPDDGYISIEQQMTAEGDIQIRFIDTGCGMSEAFISDHLFRPFKSTKGKGMGIGVYETKEIISALGGSIDVVSEEGSGTTFNITLPVAK